MSLYQLADIPEGSKPLFEVEGGLGIISEDVCGIYAYVLDPSRFDVTRTMSLLNYIDGFTDDEIDWDECNHYAEALEQEHNGEDFGEYFDAGYLKFLTRDGHPIAYVLDGNPATDRLLKVLNGEPVDPIPKDWRFLTDSKRLDMIGRTMFGATLEGDP
jgi:hypothetical protein